MSDDLIKSLPSTRIREMTEQIKELDAKLDAITQYNNELTKANEQLGVKLQQATNDLEDLSTARCFGSGEALGCDLSATATGREVLARIRYAQSAVLKIKNQLITRTNTLQSFPTVNRVEVVDSSGRAYSEYRAKEVSISLQDDQRTLKLLLGSNV